MDFSSRFYTPRRFDAFIGISGFRANFKKPCLTCIFKFHVSYCCIIDILYHSTNLEIFYFVYQSCKTFFFVHHRLVMYISLLSQLISFIYMLLTSFNCYAGPKDSRVLISSSLIRRLVRACVPRWSQMLPPKLYLVVFYQVWLVNWTRITCSDFRRPSFLLLGNFVVLYHMFIPHGGIVINVLT